MGLSARAELLKIQQRLYRRNKEIIENSILVKESNFHQYERTYRRYISRYQQVVQQEEMMTAILRSQIIYVGDYHTLNQSQRSFLRILKAVVASGAPLMVCLELLHARYQKNLNSYLAGKMGEKQFLKRVRLKEHWVFDLWENFKPIFDFCRYHRIPMFAIDAAPIGATLRERDQATGELLANIVQEHPTRQMFVFIGDLHIAPAHLPRETEKALLKKKISCRDLILYQNSVPIYWKLAEQGMEDRVEVVRIDERSFCRMHTPPIISQHSYLNWLEHEEGEIDYFDARHSFLELVDRICSFVGIKIPPKDLESVEVFTAGDLSFLKRLRETHAFSLQEIETIKKQILSSESYYIAKARFVYLANLSLNHAAEEASHFIKHMCSGLEEPRELVDAFYANVLHEALGFWGSKIINHKRKCHHEQDFKNMLTYFETINVPVDRRLEQEAAHLILEYLRYERAGQSLRHVEVFRSRVDLFLSITHALGYMLGERLYYGLMEGTMKKKAIRELFTDSWFSEGEPYIVYWDLKQKLQKVKIPKRM